MAGVAKSAYPRASQRSLRRAHQRRPDPDSRRRVRLPLGFPIRQPARQRVFLTTSGYAEFSPIPDIVPPPGRLTLSTVRYHDQCNTTIYSDDDSYRGVNLRTALFLSPEYLRERRLGEFDRVNTASFARDGNTARDTATAPWPTTPRAAACSPDARAERVVRHRRRAIADDGVGGAESQKGSGPNGSIDRFEALGGQVRISSVVGNGTSPLATIPPPNPERPTSPRSSLPLTGPN
jgi:hypothetical protein